MQFDSDHTEVANSYILSYLAHSSDFHLHVLNSFYLFTFLYAYMHIDI